MSGEAHYGRLTALPPDLGTTSESRLQSNVNMLSGWDDDLGLHCLRQVWHFGEFGRWQFGARIMF